MVGSWGGQALKTIEKRLGFVYSSVQKTHPSLDVRILLPGPGFEFAKGVADLDTIFCASNELGFVATLKDLRKSSHLAVPSVSVMDAMPPLPDVMDESETEGGGWLDSVSGSVVGGTFDRLHNGHKILLSVCCMKATDLFVCGVSDDELLTKKALKEILQPLPERIFHVADFVHSVKPSLKQSVNHFPRLKFTTNRFFIKDCSSS